MQTYWCPAHDRSLFPGETCPECRYDPVTADYPAVAPDKPMGYCSRCGTYTDHTPLSPSTTPLTPGKIHTPGPQLRTEISDS